MKKVVSILGARPQFIKAAVLSRIIRERKEFLEIIVHTGQHFDSNMSEVFFEEMDIPKPKYNLNINGMGHGAMTGRMLEQIEEVLLHEKPDLVVVYGDTNSTLAGALAAKKLGIKVAHVEAGLRSFDKRMPEEINRIVTDALSDILLVSEPSGLNNLEHEGVPSEKIHFVGNIMIDSLKRMLPYADQRRTHARYGLEAGQYAFLTMHRPSNVDDPNVLHRLLEQFDEISSDLPVLFAVHPRTRKKIKALGPGYQDRNVDFQLVDPVDYLDALCLQKNARVILTDSGGIQEESTEFGVPCLTLRDNTERPITVELGTSTLVGNDPAMIFETLDTVLSGKYKKSHPIPLWDGHTAERISSILVSHFIN